MSTTEQSRYDLRVSRVMILTGINFCVMKKIVFRRFLFSRMVEKHFLSRIFNFARSPKFSKIKSLRNY